MKSCGGRSGHPMGCSVSRNLAPASRSRAFEQRQASPRPSNRRPLRRTLWCPARLDQTNPSPAAGMSKNCGLHERSGGPTIEPDIIWSQSGFKEVGEVANLEKHKKTLALEWLDAEESSVPTQSRSTHVLGSYIKIPKPVAKKFRVPIPDQAPALPDPSMFREPGSPPKAPLRTSPNWGRNRS